MTEVVRKGIQEAQLQLQKANEERLLEEVRHKPELPGKPKRSCSPRAGCSLLTVCSQGLLRQIPVVGSVLNWFSPFQASPKGRTFNLTAGRTRRICSHVMLSLELFPIFKLKWQNAFLCWFDREWHNPPSGCTTCFSLFLLHPMRQSSNLTCTFTFCSCMLSHIKKKLY